MLNFHSKQKKIDYSKIYIKLNGSKLIPSSVAKYLVLYNDNNLSWDRNTFQLSKKLSRTNGILCKLRHLTPKSTLISIYYSLFYSHLTYGCSVWSLTSQKNSDILNILQKKCIRIITFSNYDCHTNALFIDNNLLKLNDVIESSYIKLMFNFTTNKLPAELCDMFQYSDSKHSHNTRTSFNQGFFIPSINTTSFGNKSLRYKTPLVWNNLINTHPGLLNCSSVPVLKNKLKNHYITSYKCLE